MSDSGDGLGKAIRRAAEESPRYVNSGLPLSPNIISLLKHFPRFQDLLRLWGTMSVAEQREALAEVVTVQIRADYPLMSAYRNTAYFAETADLNAQGERHRVDLEAREIAERRRQIRVVPPKETQP